MRKNLYCLDSEETFCTCVPSKATLQNTKLIYHCRTLFRSRTIGLNVFIIIQPGPITGGEDSKEGRQTVFFTAMDPMSEPQKDAPYDVKGPRVVHYRTKWKSVPECSLLDQPENCSRQRIGIFWQTNLNAIILDDSVPSDCQEKVVHYRTREILFQKIRLSPLPPPKVILKKCLAGNQLRIK